MAKWLWIGQGLSLSEFRGACSKSIDKHAVRRNVGVAALLVRLEGGKGHTGEAEVPLEPLNHCTWPPGRNGQSGRPGCGLGRK